MWQLHGSNAFGNASASIWWRHHDGSDVHNATRTRGRCKLWLFYYCFCYRNEPVLLVTYLSESQTDTQTENCNSMRCSDDFGWNCIFVTIIIVPELYEWFVRLAITQLVWACSYQLCVCYRVLFDYSICLQSVCHNQTVFCRCSIRAARISSHWNCFVRYINHSELTRLVISIELPEWSAKRVCSAKCNKMGRPKKGAFIRLNFSTFFDIGHNATYIVLHCVFMIFLSFHNFRWQWRRSNSSRHFWSGKTWCCAENWHRSSAPGYFDEGNFGEANADHGQVQESSCCHFGYSVQTSNSGTGELCSESKNSYSFSACTSNSEFRFRYQQCCQTMLHKLQSLRPAHAAKQQATPAQAKAKNIAPKSNVVISPKSRKSSAAKTRSIKKATQAPRVSKKQQKATPPSPPATPAVNFESMDAVVGAPFTSPRVFAGVNLPQVYNSLGMQVPKLANSGAPVIAKTTIGTQMDPAPASSSVGVQCNSPARVTESIGVNTMLTSAFCHLSDEERAAVGNQVLVPMNKHYIFDRAFLTILANRLNVPRPFLKETIRQMICEDMMTGECGRTIGDVTVFMMQQQDENLPPPLQPHVNVMPYKPSMAYSPMLSQSQVPPPPPIFAYGAPNQLVEQRTSTSVHVLGENYLDDEFGRYGCVLSPILPDADDAEPLSIPTIPLAHAHVPHPPPLIDSFVDINLVDHNQNVDLNLAQYIANRDIDDEVSEIIASPDVTYYGGNLTSDD